MAFFFFEKNIQSDLTKQNMTKVDIKLKEVVDTFFFFFFFESFNLWCPLLMIALYYQTKILIGF